MYNVLYRVLNKSQNYGKLQTLVQKEVSSAFLEISNKNSFRKKMLSKIEVMRKA